MITLDAVEKILTAKGIDYKRYDHYIMLSCMSGSHKDEHPSMIINSRGRVSCKSCGFNSTVSKLFDIDASELNTETTEDLSLVIEEDPKFSKIETYTFDTSDFNEFDYPLPTNFDMHPPVSKIRGISIKTLEYYDVRVSGNWTVFPVWKEDSGYRIKLGYAIRTDKGWVFSKQIGTAPHFSTFVYPLVGAHQSDYLFLVEGMFDALALIDKGFPALAMFGGWATKSKYSTDNKLKIKESFFLQYAPKHLILFFDDDPAGHEYTENAKRFFYNRYNVVDFVSSVDPDEFLLIDKNVNVLNDFVLKTINKK